jgi:hypothetical protein
VPTRRELLTTAAAVGGVGVLGRSAEAAAASQSDSPIEVLSAASRLEQLALAVYQHVISGGALSAAELAAARTIATHELAHVGAVNSALIRLGGTPPAAPRGPGAINAARSAAQVSGSVGGGQSQKDLMRLLLNVEFVLEGIYYSKAVSHLTDPVLLRMSAEIMAVEAQHTVVLNDLLYHGNTDKSVPGPFVEGNY